eukprot:gnl/TRDRNA2_/TRDRNA2_83157_c2_seq1.p1 gnl/TRDRNA2_/TRDRNA2_83157_c2~~gnl/TRDRNA2_/TRDRNA2_83157_c2_seq1.p1  ORF type:complete len:318 (-),score=54.51 gnl/TRDRNA2_/TRDRNA2_83157_c2_seq1:51-905(-)
MFHFGSICLGSLLIALTRLPRLIANAMEAVLVREANERNKLHVYEDAPNDVTGSILSGMGVAVMFVNHMFGVFDKRCYTMMVIDGQQNFCSASRRSFDFLAEQGGFCALLSGCCNLFQVVGILLITATGTFLTWLLCTQIWHFASKESDYYVDDPEMVAVMACGLLLCCSYCFMVVFEHTADTLLFCFAWCRKHNKVDLYDCTPDPLYTMMKKEMISPTDAKALQPKGTARFVQTGNFTRRSAAQGGTEFMSYAGNTMATGFMTANQGMQSMYATYNGMRSSRP